MIHLLARRCSEEMKWDLLANPQMRHAVRLQAEKLKQTLQNKSSAPFKFGTFEGTVTDEEYNVATKSLIDNISGLLCGFSYTLPDDFTLNKIVLVCGSTRLKCVHTVLDEIFPGAFKESFNLDEAAVYGAAVLAHFFQKGQLQFNGDGFEIRTSTQPQKSERRKEHQDDICN